MGSRRARSRSAERLGAIRRPCRGIRAPSRQPRWQGVRDTGAVGEARPNRHCRLHSGRLLSLDGGCGSALGDGLPSPAARPSRADQAASQWASRRALGSVHVGASRQAVDLAARADADRQRAGGGAVPRPAPPRQADQGRVQEERGRQAGPRSKASTSTATSGCWSLAAGSASATRSPGTAKKRTVWRASSSTSPTPPTPTGRSTCASRRPARRWRCGHG